MSRAEVRLLACPECGASVGQKCVGIDGQERRASNHQGRVNAYRAKLLAPQEKKVMNNEIIGKMPFDRIQVESTKDAAIVVSFHRSGKPLLVLAPVHLQPSESYFIDCVEGNALYKITST